MSAAAAHSEKINDVLIAPDDLEWLVQTLRLCKRVSSLMFEFDRSRVEIEQNLIANHLQTKCVHKSIIKDRITLREIWMQQALILISQVLSFVLIHAQLFNNCTSPFNQGEYQDAHMLLKYSLESSHVSYQYFIDSSYDQNFPYFLDL